MYAVLGKESHLSLDNLLHPSPDGAALLRNEPVQARSTARLASLLDAAAAVVDEVGYERLTTALVAERAGASIGTVYRYFPDRIVVLQGLSARFLTDSLEQITRTARNPDHGDWWQALDGVIDNLVDSFERVPGFRSLRFGDVLDLRPTSKVSGTSSVAEVVSEALAERFGLDRPELQFHVTVALEVADALIARAFSTEHAGNEQYISEARNIVRAYLIGFYGDPEGS
jgi:AcrR family transcriptional regulator